MHLFSCPLFCSWAISGDNEYICIIFRRRMLGRTLAAYVLPYLLPSFLSPKLCSSDRKIAPNGRRRLQGQQNGLAFVDQKPLQDQRGDAPFQGMVWLPPAMFLWPCMTHPCIAQPPLVCSFISTKAQPSIHNHEAIKASFLAPFHMPTHGAPKNMYIHHKGKVCYLCSNITP